MLERQPIEIKFVEGEPSKRDYCKVAPSDQIRSALSCLLILEEQLSQNSLTRQEREGATLAHTIIWSSLPDYYKSELADLTAITA